MHFTLDSNNGGRTKSDGHKGPPHPAGEQPLPDKGLLHNKKRTMHTHTHRPSTEE